MYSVSSPSVTSLPQAVPAAQSGSSFINLVSRVVRSAARALADFGRWLNAGFRSILQSFHIITPPPVSLPPAIGGGGGDIEEGPYSFSSIGDSPRPSIHNSYPGIVAAHSEAPSYRAATAGPIQPGAASFSLRNFRAAFEKALGERKEGMGEKQMKCAKKSLNDVCQGWNSQRREKTLENLYRQCRTSLGSLYENRYLAGEYFLDDNGYALAQDALEEAITGRKVVSRRGAPSAAAAAALPLLPKGNPRCQEVLEKYREGLHQAIRVEGQPGGQLKTEVGCIIPALREVFDTCESLERLEKEALAPLGQCLRLGVFSQNVHDLALRELKKAIAATSTHPTPMVAT